MKTLNVSRPTSNSTSRFISAKTLAYSLAESDSKLIEPELIAWNDRLTALSSPVLEGCSGPTGWHDYALSHGGYLEVNVGDESTFIFAESSPFDSFEHFAPSPYINIRNAKGEDMICNRDGLSCVPIDEWTSNLP